MPHKSKYSPEIKEQAVLDYLNGTKGASETTNELGIDYSTLQRWVALYKGGGIDALTPKSENRHYPKELKKQVVEEYLGSQSSVIELVTKYEISSNRVVRRWIKQYNSHVEFKSNQTGSEIYMAKGRTTTSEEREEIVKYCIAHSKYYRGAMEEYGVSYTQV